MDAPTPRIITIEHDETYGKFVVEPLERGYGVTLGNSLRRMMLSSLPGAAVTSVRIDGVLHEFATIPGLLEDTTEIILNLKNLHVKVLNGAAAEAPEEPWVLRVDKRGEGSVTGADVETPSALEIVNPEHHLASLADDNAALTMEMTVEVGVGHLLPQNQTQYQDQIGVIPVGPTFSPVAKVNFALEDTRIGSRSDLERLILEVWTNGTVAPGEALHQGAEILDRYVRLFLSVSGDSVAEPLEEEPGRPIGAPVASGAPDIRIEELDFSVRTYNCLKKADVQTIADLVQTSGEELMNIRNFGRKSLIEVQEKLNQYGYALSGETLPAEADGEETEPEE